MRLIRKLNINISITLNKEIIHREHLTEECKITTFNPHIMLIIMDSIVKSNRRLEVIQATGMRVLIIGTSTRLSSMNRLNKRESLHKRMKMELSISSLRTTKTKSLLLTRRMIIYNHHNLLQIINRFASHRPTSKLLT
jgi:hypothetical protein